MNMLRFMYDKLRMKIFHLARKPSTIYRPSDVCLFLLSPEAFSNRVCATKYPFDWRCRRIFISEKSNSNLCSKHNIILTLTASDRTTSVACIEANDIWCTVKCALKLCNSKLIPKDLTLRWTLKSVGGSGDAIKNLGHRAQNFCEAF